LATNVKIFDASWQSSGKVDRVFQLGTVLQNGGRVPEIERGIMNVENSQLVGVEDSIGPDEMAMKRGVAYGWSKGACGGGTGNETGIAILTRA
jgi:hypothetical protein